MIIIWQLSLCEHYLNEKNQTKTNISFVDSLENKLLSLTYIRQHANPT